MGIFGVIKVATWQNNFWRLMAGAIAGVGLIQAVRNGKDAKNTCKK